MDGGDSEGAPQAVYPTTDLRWIEPGKSRERSGVQRRLLRGVRTWSVGRVGGGGVPGAGASETN